jgi:hypothetical protein
MDLTNIIEPITPSLEDLQIAYRHTLSVELGHGKFRVDKAGRGISGNDSGSRFQHHHLSRPPCKTKVGLFK